MTDREYELKLKGGKVATWQGRDGIDAATRYVDVHRTATVLAWREPRHGLFIGAPQ
jgi:hypothetical protein